jgi:predicted nucleotidyltransferase
MGVASVPETVGRASRVTPTGFHTPVADELPEVVERLVSKLCPERIILFGSYAYGRPTPDSDVDLLVILETDASTWRSTRFVDRLAS